MTNHKFTLQVSPDIYTRVTSALTVLGHMKENEIMFNSTILDSRYDSTTSTLTLTILKKPGFLGFNYVERKTREWLRSQGVTGA